ncbi:D-TA family PLP-dependent enzyme [Aurantibacter crassamenti]|uniref:D-TA family PLP-dependent enzyme n=1 Tax=Aurantibacter crassamenti TaxID=1837375 RepID=UPI001939403A|nr:D-TA family PLP-dependent enzyme [Aurantibacter crassamenti]MBM1105052.1 D-TA family PLP-dependent enzyme [Aurantibacter crassamenti]
MLSGSNTYCINDVSQIDSPALLVFHDIVEDNIENALNKVVDSQNTILRPHIKTVKCIEVVQLAMSKGVDRFKCSTIAEAELLGMAGAKDVLLCYQLSETKAKRFAALRQKYPKTLFSALVDNIKSASILSHYFKKLPLAVFIDINVGMNRTGVKTNEALSFITEINVFKGLIINGLHAYDGHVHNSDEKIRKHQADAIFHEVSTLKNEVENLLLKKLTLVIGGSPSFPFYAKQNGVECSPGTFFFWDVGYGTSFSEMPFTPAATILTRIISIIDNEKICLDLGTKATATDPPQPRVDIMGLENGVIVDQFEEHLVVHVPDTSQYEVGEPFLAIPFHICPTVNLYEELTIIENGDVTDIWKVLARNRKITI